MAMHNIFGKERENVSDLEEHYDKIYRYCFFKLGQREIAEDITQETFLRFLNHKNYRNTGNMLPCLYTIARHLCIDEYRKKKPVSLESEEQLEDTAAEERMFNGVSIRWALAKLEEEERELILLRYVNEVPVAVICKMFGISRYYEDTEEKEDHRKYNAIYSFVASISDYEDVLTVDEETLYQIRQEKIMQDWVLDLSLSEMEETLWRGREEKIATPFVYEYCAGFAMLFSQINLINYLWILLCAICLSGFFSNEHLRRMDQIILCSRYGRKPVYFAKMAAGVTFSLSGTILFYMIGGLFSIGIYGVDGFHAAIQLYIWTSSWNISIGEAVCILFLVSLCGAVCCSMFTMMMSELMRSAAAVLSLISGTMILTLFVSVPARYRVLSRMCALIPTKAINEIGFIDNRMIHVFGKYVSILQAAPVVYLVLAVGFGWIGYAMYKRYQVSGR